MDAFRFFLMGAIKLLAAMVVVVACGVGILFVAVEVLGIVSGYGGFENIVIVMVGGVGLVFSVLAFCYLLRWRWLVRVVVSGLFWIACAAFILCAVGFAVIAYIESRGSLTVFMIVLISAGVVIGSYVAYFIATMIVGFFGSQFLVLGAALPRGRGVLFTEMLNSGYSKPQTRAFLVELSEAGGRGNAGMVYTTFILYGIPILTFIGVLTEVTGLLGRSS